MLIVPAQTEAQGPFQVHCLRKQSTSTVAGGLAP